MELYIINFIFCIVLNSWVTYILENYFGSSIVFYQNNFYCRSDSAVRSVRHVGHPSDISISTISLFGETRYNGNMTQHTSDVPNYAGTFSSFVVTPPGLATFYTQPNYSGLSICLKPYNGYITHYTRDIITDLGLVAGQIKSMKFGCDSTNIHYSSPMSFKD